MTLAVVQVMRGLMLYDLPVEELENLGEFLAKFFFKQHQVNLKDKPFDRIL